MVSSKTVPEIDPEGVAVGREDESGTPVVGTDVGEEVAAGELVDGTADAPGAPMVGTAVAAGDPKVGTDVPLGGVGAEVEGNLSSTKS